MSDSTNCPHNTPWCADHLADKEQCVSPALDIDGAHISAWILQEMQGVQPIIQLDTGADGGQLNPTQAMALAQGLLQLADSIVEDVAVRS